MQNIINHNLTADEQLIKYLDLKLKDNFKKEGKNLFISINQKDKVFVFINKTNMLIVKDGIFSSTPQEMLNLIDLRKSDLTEKEILKLYNKHYLENILKLF